MKKIEGERERKTLRRKESDSERKIKSKKEIARNYWRKGEERVNEFP